MILASIDRLQSLVLAGNAPANDNATPRRMKREYVEARRRGQFYRCMDPACQDCQDGTVHEWEFE